MRIISLFRQSTFATRLKRCGINLAKGSRHGTVPLALKWKCGSVQSFSAFALHVHGVFKCFEVITVVFQRGDDLLGFSARLQLSSH